MVNDSVPISRRALCAYCGATVDTNQPGTYRRAIGWLPIGRFANNRQGSNSLTLRKSLDQYACWECIDKLKSGIPFGQMSLLEPDDIG